MSLVCGPRFFQQSGLLNCSSLGPDEGLLLSHLIGLLFGQLMQSLLLGHLLLGVLLPGLVNGLLVGELLGLNNGLPLGKLLGLQLSLGYGLLPGLGRFARPLRAPILPSSLVGLHLL